MRVLLYLVSVGFLCFAVQGVVILAMFSAAPVGQFVAGPMGQHDYFAAATTVFHWVCSIALAPVSLVLGIYVFSLARGYQQNPRRAVRAFLHVVGIALLFHGVWWATLMEGLAGGASVEALVFWGAPPVAAGVFVLVLARRYRLSEPPPAIR